MYIVFFQMPAVVEICPDISSRGGGGGGGGLGGGGGRVAPP